MKKTFMLLTLLPGTALASWITFSQTPNLPIPQTLINPGVMPPAQILIDQSFTILDLDVTLDITHSDISDLNIQLTSPSGTTIELKSTWLPLWRQKRTNMTRTVFNDEASIPLQLGQPPYTGQFQSPNLALTLFNTENAQGLWSLTINDPVYMDYGQLNFWQLRFQHAPEPNSLIMIILGTTLINMRRRTA